MKVIELILPGKGVGEKLKIIAKVLPVIDIKK